LIELSSLSIFELELIKISYQRRIKMSSTVIAGIEPKILWQRFFEITQVPRPSKKEEKIKNYLRNLLNQLKLEYKEDKTGNIVVYVKATPGYEKAPIVVLQGHVDMVCEKNKDKVFDFESDPIELLREDGWITANGTTLGSDNGIGVAAALAVVTDKEIVHGPLELLFTVDEETGLTGANNLEPGFVKGKVLLNMDSEEDGAFYVGCSGGIDTIATFNIQPQNTPAGSSAFEILVTGLKGGHSGLDIITGRGNGIKILARALKEIESLNFKLASIDGGSLRNAIPREADAVIYVDDKNIEKLKSTISDFEKNIFNEFKTVDAGVKVILKPSTKRYDKVFEDSFTKKIVNTLLAVPHGVIAMSPDIQGLVETSTNLATIKADGNQIKIGTSQRSSVHSAKNYIAKSVNAVFSLAGAEIMVGDGYPGWKPNLESKILKLSKKVFKELFNKEPEIKAIHAGLECGILESKNPGMDMISFGPTIVGAHSPDEKVNIETVEKFYRLLKGILKEVALQK
jgi:dipeptidase D